MLKTGFILAILCFNFLPFWTYRKSSFDSLSLSRSKSFVTTCGSNPFLSYEANDLTWCSLFFVDCLISRSKMELLFVSSAELSFLSRSRLIFELSRLLDIPPIPPPNALCGLKVTLFFKGCDFDSTRSDSSLSRASNCYYMDNLFITKYSFMPFRACFYCLTEPYCGRSCFFSDLSDFRWKLSGMFIFVSKWVLTFNQNNIIHKFKNRLEKNYKKYET